VLVDGARIYAKAGDGGNGSSSFRREKYVPRGGPDGGDGGRGGDVVLRVKPNLTSLLPFQYNQRFKADDGGNGMKRQKHGKAGADRFVDVPPGTMVWSDEAGDLLADLTEPGDEVVVAQGGKGGRGNVHFKSAVRQAPKLAELGEPGGERWLRLELRLIADVGLVGLPNAGKSTLLAAASAARPKIADYPFTTLEPNLGVVEVGGKGGESFVLADIPGLIEGAASGSGLGHEFLRHVTRTKLLIHVVDASGGLEERNPLDDFQTIARELSAYDPILATKPTLVALNKIDLPEAQERARELRAVLGDEGQAIFNLSAATGEGVSSLMNATAQTLRDLAEEDEIKEKPQGRRRYTLASVDDRSWHVEPQRLNRFAVIGVGMERLMRMTDFANDDAVERFQHVLDKSGVSEELTRLGVEQGDLVDIGGHELVWGEAEEPVPAHRSRSRRVR